MIDASVIERARSVTIESVLAQRRLWARMSRHGTEYVGPCPRCGGADRFSFSIRKQIWNCRQCKPGTKITGNVIGLVCWLDGVEFAEAIEMLLGERVNTVAAKPSAPVTTPKPKQNNDDGERLRRADGIWRASVPIAGTPGETWLAARGIDIAAVPEHGGLRFHPRCPWELGEAPCIVARFTDARTNAPLGIHRRPITIKEKPKAFGLIGGGVIRLWPDEDIAEGLVIGEGVETTLAAATRIEHRCTLLQPAWACGSAGTLAAFPVLAGIEALTILVDNDLSGAGQKAARQCAERLALAGREVTLLTPDDLGTDFNDLVRS
jgi:putative DNA primase/helicase